MKNKVLGLALATAAALSMMAGVASAQQPPVDDGVCGYVVDGFDIAVRNGFGAVVTNGLAYSGECVVEQPSLPGDQYIVFFDFDSSAITPAAATIITAAAEAAVAAHAHGVDVSGYTDTSGSPAYNVVLSQRRADSVAGALAEQGVDSGIITTSAFGETNLLVPTPDGVRNPENRRAVIELH